MKHDECRCYIPGLAAAIIDPDAPDSRQNPARCHPNKAYAWGIVACIVDTCLVWIVDKHPISVAHTIGYVDEYSLAVYQQTDASKSTNPVGEVADAECRTVFDTTGIQILANSL